MAKRFIDTGLFDDSWFMDLSKDGKIAWIYLLTKCDHAGIIEINERLFKIQTGLNSLDTVKKDLGNRLIHVKDHYYFIPKFIHYQYPNFPHSKARAQNSAIDILKKFNLLNEEDLTVNKELTNSYDNDNNNGYNDGNKERSCLFINSEFNDYSTFVKAMGEYAGGKYKSADMNYYYESVKNWSQSKQAKKVDWIATASGFILRDIRDGKMKKNK